MAQSKLRGTAAALTKGAKALTDVARRIRALDALGVSLTEEQLQAAFSKIVGELRVFRATTLQQTIEALSPQESESEVEAG
jgi:hypothetical protein